VGIETSSRINLAAADQNLYARPELRQKAVTLLAAALGELEAAEKRRTGAGAAPHYLGLRDRARMM